MIMNTMRLTARPETILRVVTSFLITVQLWITYCSIAIARVQLYYHGKVPILLNDIEIHQLPFYVANDFDMLIFFCGLLFFPFFFYPLIFSCLIYIWQTSFKQCMPQRNIAIILSFLCAMQFVVNILIVYHFGYNFLMLLE